MYSDIVVSQFSGQPMYLQIMDQVKQKIAVGEWAAGGEIPSIRQLAVVLRVSVITVKRAYLELEREGVIVTHHGKGSFVAPDPALARASMKSSSPSTWSGRAPRRPPSA